MKTAPLRFCALSSAARRSSSASSSTRKRYISAAFDPLRSFVPCACLTHGGSQADLFLQDNDGNTPLSAAVEVGLPDAVRTLLDMAGPRAREMILHERKDGVSVFFVACYQVYLRSSVYSIIRYFFLTCSKKKKKKTH
jgi:ankyrin repeat protein